MIYNDINYFRYAMDCEEADKCAGSVGYPLLQAVLLLQTDGWRKQKSPPVMEGREVRIGMDQEALGATTTGAGTSTKVSLCGAWGSQPTNASMTKKPIT